MTITKAREATSPPEAEETPTPEHPSGGRGHRRPFDEIDADVFPAIGDLEEGASESAPPPEEDGPPDEGTERDDGRVTKACAKRMRTANATARREDKAAQALALKQGIDKMLDLDIHMHLRTGLCR